jgi:hypothetical protein
MAKQVHFKVFFLSQNFSVHLQRVFPSFITLALKNFAPLITNKEFPFPLYLNNFLNIHCSQRQNVNLSQEKLILSVIYLPLILSGVGRGTYLIENIEKIKHFTKS